MKFLHSLLLLFWSLLLMSRTNAAKPQPTPASGVVDARLVNGDRVCSGHLEMKHQGQWRTLKLRSDFESFSAVGFAETACRQMGCGSAASFNLIANTTVLKPAWEVSFICRDIFQSIRECKLLATSRRPVQEDSTVSSIFVECAESVRFATFTRCSGKVMVKSGQSWVHVCQSEGDKNEELMVKMMCADLGCGINLNAKHFSVESAVESRIVQCHGNETRIDQCPSSAHGDCKNVLHIDCHDPCRVRLVGESRCSGVIEGKIEAEWRPLMTTWHRLKEDHLMDLCRDAGCGNVISSTYSYLSQKQPVWDMPQNSDITACSHWKQHNGQVNINIACTEDVRLAYGPDKSSGYVEIWHKGEWRHLCHDGFTSRHAFIGCRDLNYGFPRELSKTGTFNVPTCLNLNCSGQEEHLADCLVSSLPAECPDAGCNAAFLTCDWKPSAPKMTMFSRLADVRPKGISAYIGHRIFVTCSADSLFRVRSFLLKVTLRGGTELIGNQTTVDNTAHFEFDFGPNQKGPYVCLYDYEFNPDVFSERAQFYLNVLEHSYVRLVGGESRCLGSLELEHGGEWRALSQQFWGLKEAAVVCRQLHCGSVISSDTQSRELQPVWRFFSDCNGSERALLACGSAREGMSTTTVRVLCSDIVAKPNITILADKFYPENTEQVVVHVGHTFFINCSVEPRFPGGQFTLVLSGSKKVTLNEAASNYWAVFRFWKVSKDDSGNYSCFYQNTVSQHDFTFESKTVTITVEEPDNVMLDDGRQRDDGSKACSGTLMIRDQTSQTKMVTAETSGWDMSHASIVCRQLSCGDAVSISKIDLQAFKSMWRFFSDCDGSEAALLECVNIDEWFSSTAIQVVCAGHS